MSHKLPVRDFKWVWNESKFYEDFIKSYNEDNDKLYFLEVNVQNPENYMKVTMIYHFQNEKWKGGKSL